MNNWDEEELNHILFDLQRSVESLLERGWLHMDIYEEVEDIITDWANHKEERIRSKQ